MSLDCGRKLEAHAGTGRTEPEQESEPEPCWLLHQPTTSATICLQRALFKATLWSALIWNHLDGKGLSACPDEAIAKRIIGNTLDAVPARHLKVVVFSRLGYLHNDKEQGSSGQGVSVGANRYHHILHKVTPGCHRLLGTVTCSEA